MVSPTLVTIVNALVAAESVSLAQALLLCSRSYLSFPNKTQNQHIPKSEVSIFPPTQTTLCYYLSPWTASQVKHDPTQKPEWIYLWLLRSSELTQLSCQFYLLPIICTCTLTLASFLVFKSSSLLTWITACKRITTGLLPIFPLHL